MFVNVGEHFFCQSLRHRNGTIKSKLLTNCFSETHTQTTGINCQTRSSQPRVFCENYGENWLHYNGTALYLLCMDHWGMHPWRSVLSRGKQCWKSDWRALVDQSAAASGLGPGRTCSWPLLGPSAAEVPNMVHPVRPLPSRGGPRGSVSCATPQLTDDIVSLSSDPRRIEVRGCSYQTWPVCTSSSRRIKRNKDAASPWCNHTRYHERDESEVRVNDCVL